MTATQPNRSNGEKVSENVFASIEQGEGRFDASIDVFTSGALHDNTTELTVDVGPMQVTIGLTPEQSKELRQSLKENEQGAADE